MVQSQRLAHRLQNLNNHVEEAIFKVNYVLLPRHFAKTAETFVLDVLAALDEYNASDLITKKIVVST